MGSTFLEFGHWLRSQDPGATTVAPAPGVVSPLIVQGVGILQAGKMWKCRSVTAFRAPELYARDEVGWVDDYYRACLDLGANTVRWFAMWANTDYSPLTGLFASSYYDDLEAALLHAKAAGLYVHLTAFCDQVPGSTVWIQTPSGHHDEAGQAEHLIELIEMSKRTGNVLLEVSNEDWKNGNIAARFDKAAFAGTISTRSSWPETGPPTDPQSCGSWLQWSTKHLERTYDWPRKGKVLYEIQYEGLGSYPPARIPAISGEPQRIGEGTTPRQHADNAAVCEIMGAGGCLHGGFSSFDSSHDNDLQNCRMSGTPDAMAAAQAVGAVWKSTVLDMRAGTTEKLVRGTEYDDGPCPVHHRDRYNTDSPHNEPEKGANRTYFKILDNDQLACGLAVDPAPHWPGYVLRADNGWRIVDQGGFEGNLLRLSR